MPGFLRQSTASQSRALGPFIDDTDFKTPKTALTIANTDIKLVVNGAASVNKNSGGGTHRINGVYGVTFDATDTAAVGEIEVSVVVASALPVFDKFTVLEEAVYDALFAASAAGFGDTSGVTTLLSRVGTPSDLGGGASISANLSDIEAQTDDIGVAGAGLTALGDTRLANLDAAITTRSTLTEANIRTAVGLATANLDTQLAAIDDAVDTEVAGIKAQTDKLTFDGDNHVAANIKKVKDDAAAADTLKSYLDGSEFMPVDAHAQDFDAHTVPGQLTTKKPDGTTNTAYSPKTLTTNASAEPITKSV